MIKSLLTFKLNKKKSPLQVIDTLVKFVEEQTSQNKNITTILEDISKNTNIPMKILQQKTNQILYKNYDLKFNKFKKKNLNYIFLDIIKYFLLTVINILGHLSFFFIKNNKKNYTLLCDNVFSQLDVDRFTNLIKSFNKICLLGNFSKKNKVKKEDYFKFNKLFIGRSNTSLKEKFFFITLGFKVLYLSIKCRFNLFTIFLYLVYDIYKSSYIFSCISSKYFLTQKFYGTSPVFNFYFKKSGGKIAACTQKNILNLSLSAFVFTDVMFTLGKDQGKICNKLGGKIIKFTPVGSFFMEDAWFRKKRDLKNVPSSDILIIGVNTLGLNDHYISNIYKNNYYNYYCNWLKKLAIDFKEKNIILKHHRDYVVDPEEAKILKDTNIKIFVENNSMNSSYGWAFKSKLVLSFSSTMIVEILGHGKEAYYIDPYFNGSQWFSDIKNLKKFRLRTYKSINSIVKKKKKTKINKNLSQYYCVNSKNTSKMIAAFLKNKKNLELFN
jgi:hypothetical protein